MIRLGQKMAEYMQTSTFQNFNRETDPFSGQKWKPRKYNAKTKRGLSRGKTVSRKVKSKKLLMMTGAMRRGTFWRSKLTGRNLTLIGGVSGSASDYAETHQEGRGNIPQRRYMGAGRIDRMRIFRIARKHLPL